VYTGPAQSAIVYPLENVHVNLCTSYMYRTHFNSTMNHYMVEAMVEGGGGCYAKEPSIRAHHDAIVQKAVMFEPGFARLNERSRRIAGRSRCLHSGADALWPADIGAPRLPVAWQ